MGMLFFGIMVLGFMRRQAGNVVARGLYPGLAKKLGLSYEPSEYKKGVGRLTGDYGGYRVTVDPDDQRRIFVRFAAAPAVELHSYAHNKRSSPGQRSFRPASRILSQQFKTAHASAPLIEAFNDDKALPALLKPIKFIRELKTLSVTSGGVTAIFEYGNPPYIPAGIVEDLLPRLVGLARIFEPPVEAPGVRAGESSEDEAPPFHSAERETSSAEPGS
jgi:hypothetical protein